MIRACRRNDEYMLMLLDAFTMRVLNSCAKVSDCVEAGVTVLLPIASDRIEAVPMPAIYFLEPSEASIAHLVQDFTNKALYPHVHLFFTSPLDKALEDKIVSCDLLMDRLRTLKIVNTEFVAKEQRLALLNRPAALPSLYMFGGAQNERLGAYQLEVERTARQLAAMCASMSELPYVRFSARSKLTQDIAARLEDELEKMRVAMAAAADDAASAPHWNPNRGVLLVVDRSIDPVAPLMHEFTYQAAMHDLHQFKGDLITTPGMVIEKNPRTNKMEEVPVLIDEYDKLWQRFRHAPVPMVGPQLTSEWQAFLKENDAIVRMQKGKEAGDDDDDEAKSSEKLKAMAKVASKLPAYEATKKQYTKHINLSAFILDALTRLKEIAELEQDMATGLDVDGNKTKKITLGQRLIEFISDDTIDSAVKLRLIMIYMISQDGIDANTRTKIFKAAAIEAEHSQAVLNLNNLGVTLQSSNQKAKGGQRLRDDQIEKYKELAQEAQLEVLRFVPLLSEVMSELVNGKLSVSAKDGYPYANPNTPLQAPSKNTRVAASSFSSSSSSAASSAKPSGSGFGAIQTRAQREAAREERLRGGAGASAASAAASASAAEHKDDDKPRELVFRDDGPKFMVYVAGGCAHSEVRCAYELAAGDAGAQLLMCANRVLTAHAFVNELMCRGEDEAAGASADDVKVDVK